MRGLGHEASAHQLPSQTARQLPDLSTVIWVDSSSTGYPCLFGAHPKRRTCDTPFSLSANALRNSMDTAAGSFLNVLCIKAEEAGCQVIFAPQGQASFVSFRAAASEKRVSPSAASLQLWAS
jgi:hypothetical protein